MKYSLPLFLLGIFMASASTAWPADDAASGEEPAIETVVAEDVEAITEESKAQYIPTEAENKKNLQPKFEDRRHFIGSSLFMLANLIPLDDPPHFYQLNYGYRLTPKDTISVEAITWTYHAPLGVPYSSLEDPAYAYPGTVQEFGLGFAYQRFLWKGLYTALHALPLYQKYVDLNGDVIQTGFQLFLTYRLGYHFSFFKDRFFIEPGIAATYWPINTNVPDAFAAQEARWPNYFLVEPGFHFGVNF